MRPIYLCKCLVAGKLHNLWLRSGRNQIQPEVLVLTKRSELQFSQLDKSAFDPGNGLDFDFPSTRPNVVSSSPSASLWSAAVCLFILLDNLEDSFLCLQCGDLSDLLDLLGFLELLGEGGHDFEDIADDGVVGDFEDGSVLVFVDGDDGARAFHAHDVLNRAADAERKIELRRDGLAGAADLAVHGKPAFIADGPGRGDFAANGFSELLGQRNIFGRLDAASDG